MSELSVGINWDIRLIPRLASLKKVKEVFGSANQSIFGSGRSAVITAKASDTEIEEYIKDVHRHGMKFNYTMNAPCLDNKEFDCKNHLKIIRHIEWLVKAGVDSVTVTIPYLLEIIKKQFPTLRTKVSMIAAVNSVCKATYFEDMGADEIVIDSMINRDFNTLKKIRQAVQCDLSISANESCLKDCAYRNYHYNIGGHSSQADHFANGFLVEYPAFKCNMERIKDSSHYIRSPWIRPEDLGVYENLGFNKFKVSGRTFTSDWIFNAANAYNEGWYSGNLYDILNAALPGQSATQGVINVDIIFDKATRMKTDSLGKIVGFVPQKPFINNDLLDDFIIHFTENKCVENCKACSYCKDIASKVFSLAKHDENAMDDHYSAIIDDLVTSRMFISDEERAGLSESECNEECPVREIEKTEIIWPENIKKHFNEAMSNIPKLVAVFARKSYSGIIEENARRRGAAEINESDFVNAILLKTPPHVRSKMICGLEKMGIDLKKYMNN